MRAVRASLRIFLTVSAVCLSASPGSEAAPVKLTPQDVVDLALGKGFRAQQAALDAQLSYLRLEQARNVFDLRFTFRPSYEHDEAQDLSGMSNLIDRTFAIESVLSKKLQSGTTVALGYQSMRQASVLTSFTQQALRSPDASLEAARLEIRQALWQNAFGFADRLAVEIRERDVERALSTREENLEEVLLDAMTLFWQTYTAQQRLTDSIEARERYQRLIRTVRRRAGFNLSRPGELPSLEAEGALAEQNIKKASAAYLNVADQLKRTLRLDADGLELEVPEALPPVPRLPEKQVEDLRSIQTARLALENARRNVERVHSLSRAHLDVVLRARSTGVDESESEALAEMASTTRPTYFVGLEFETTLDSSQAASERAGAAVQLSQAEIALALARDSALEKMDSLARTTASLYAVAKSSIEVVAHRQEQVRQMEAAYRQGRQPLRDLIQSFDELNRALEQRALAIGDYHIALNRWAAARDELIAQTR